MEKGRPILFSHECFKKKFEERIEDSKHGYQNAVIAESQKNRRLKEIK